MTRKHRSLFSIRNIVVSILVLIVVGYLGYSVYVFQNSEEKHEGFFVCNMENTECELSQHIHADIEMNVCGETIEFPKEQGKTNLQHTHKEHNLIHWHTSIRVSPDTREPFYPSPMYLRSFLTQMNYTLPQTCPDNPTPEVTVMINSEIAENGLDTRWYDDNHIVVLYK